MILLLFCHFFLADSLLFANQYELALVEYKRLFFFDSSAQENLQLRLHYTIALFHQNRFSGYEEMQKLLNKFSEIDTESKLRLAKELINTENYNLAIDILKPLSGNNYRLKKILGFSYLFNRQYYNALREFQKIDRNLTMEIEKFIKRPEKSITRAMLLSALLPGSGEVYAGDIKKGLQDFALNFLSGFLIYNSIKNKKYFDAGIVFSFAFNRFYFGSISNAGRLAQKKNEKVATKWLEYIKEKYYKEDSETDY